ALVGATLTTVTGGSVGAAGMRASASARAAKITVAPRQIQTLFARRRDWAGGSDEGAVIGMASGRRGELSLAGMGLAVGGGVVPFAEPRVCSTVPVLAVALLLPAVLAAGALGAFSGLMGEIVDRVGPAEGSLRLVGAPG